MIRVLHIFHEMANGGIEHFVMDYYRHIDRSKIQFDFLVSTNKKGYFDNEIQHLGGMVYHAYPLKKNPVKCYFDIAKIVRENHYQIVHRHTGSAFGYFELHAAKHGGAKHLILHSHNNAAGNIYLHKISSVLLKMDCIKLACSKEAGEWLFGKNGEFSIISNAIDCGAFKYDANKRMHIRSSLKIQDELVIGHVGRFEKQKNHSFLLQIFNEILKNHPDSYLVCIGDGSLLPETREQAKRLGVRDKIKFLGSRNDVNIIMNAFDYFVLPSNYEGFGITLLEAQANGLPCFTSKDVVPTATNVTGSIHYLSLQDSASKWAEAILNEKKCRYLRNIESIADKGFDITSNAKQLSVFYEELVSKC